MSFLNHWLFSTVLGSYDGRKKKNLGMINGCHLKFQKLFYSSCSNHTNHIILNYPKKIHFLTWFLFFHCKEKRFSFGIKNFIFLCWMNFFKKSAEMQKLCWSCSGHISYSFQIRRDIFFAPTNNSCVGNNNNGGDYSRGEKFTPAAPQFAVFPDFLFSWTCAFNVP